MIIAQSEDGSDIAFLPLDGFGMLKGTNGQELGKKTKDLRFWLKAI
jgi:hypothetical protein